MAPKSSISFLLTLLPFTVMALNPNCSPGGNFDMGFWNLQLPTGSPGSIDTIRSRNLQGCNGYSGPTFFTDQSTGELVMTAPGNPAITSCATTSGSSHCRTELREVQKSNGQNAAWPPTGTNTLTVTMKVIQADDGTHGTAIGQVFASQASKPLAEMYYSRGGKIVVGVKPNATGNQIITQLGTVPVGQQFTYQMSYSNNVLSISINGNRTPLSTYEWNSPLCYFKAGNYNQAKTAASSEVRITSIVVNHS